MVNGISQAEENSPSNTPRATQTPARRSKDTKTSKTQGKESTGEAEAKVEAGREISIEQLEARLKRKWEGFKWDEVEYNDDDDDDDDDDKEDGVGLKGSVGKIIAKQVKGLKGPPELGGSFVEDDTTKKPEVHPDQASKPLDDKRSPLSSVKSLSSKPTSTLGSSSSTTQGSFKIRAAPVSDSSSQGSDNQKVAVETDSLQKKKVDRLSIMEGYLPFEFKKPETASETFEGSLFSNSTFRDLGVEEAVVKRLESSGILNPTKIQELTVPFVSQFKDAVVHAHTGSGKTLAYLLPILPLLTRDRPRNPQALILTPSRELAQQIALVAAETFQDIGINSIALIGGANVQRQIEKLQKDRPQIIVATPGRLGELVFRMKRLKLNSLRALIIDEIDAMLSGSTAGELQTIMENIPLLRDRATKISNDFDMSSELSVDSSTLLGEEQDEGEGSVDGEDVEKTAITSPNTPGVGRRRSIVLLASATGDSESVVAFANKHLAKGWSVVKAPSATTLPRTVTHAVHVCPRIKTFDALKKLFSAEPAPSQALIFVNDPHRVGIVCDKLYENGIIAAPLAGDTSKEDRKEVMIRMRDGRVRVVVTTELAARGLDFPDLTHVVNLEQATDAEHYVHRAGRCGRAGKPGLVISFVTADMKFVLGKFAKKLKFQLHDSMFYDGKLWLRRPGRHGKRD